MYQVYLAAIALIAAFMDVLSGSPVALSLLLWLLVVMVGLGGIWAFLGHYLKSDEVAGYIGWPKGNPFQKEVAFTNLAMGTCGLLCYFIRDGFWLATIVFVSVFLLGAASVHVRERRRSGNRNPGNAGPVFYADILLPVALWILHAIY